MALYPTEVPSPPGSISNLHAFSQLDLAYLPLYPLIFARGNLASLCPNKPWLINIVQFTMNTVIRKWCFSASNNRFHVRLLICDINIWQNGRNLDTEASSYYFLFIQKFKIECNLLEWHLFPKLISTFSKLAIFWCISNWGPKAQFWLFRLRVFQNQVVWYS